MASDKEYLEYVLDQMSDLADVAYRPMMGEYVLYYRGKVIGGIYDDRLLLKPTPSVRALLADAPLVRPYEGAGEMVYANPDEKDLLQRVIAVMWDELPTPKKKK